MGILKNYIAHLNTITAEQQESAVLKIVSENYDAIIKYNQSQLLEGKNSKGDSLFGYRSRKYKSFKLLLNPKGVTDLRVSGSLYEHMFIRASKFPVSIFSNDKKANNLTKKYGKDIFGLSKENKASLNKDRLKAPIQKYYRKLLWIR